MKASGQNQFSELLALGYLPSLKPTALLSPPEAHFCLSLTSSPFSVPGNVLCKSLDYPSSIAKSASLVPFYWLLDFLLDSPFGFMSHLLSYCLSFCFFSFFRPLPDLFFLSYVLFYFCFSGIPLHICVCVNIKI